MSEARAIARHQHPELDRGGTYHLACRIQHLSNSPAVRALEPRLPPHLQEAANARHGAGPRAGQGSQQSAETARAGQHETARLLEQAAARLEEAKEVADFNDYLATADHAGRAAKAPASEPRTVHQV